MGTTLKQRAIRANNPYAKTRKKDNPYEIWTSYDGMWKWYVLKKWQADDDKPLARWFCFVMSPFCGGGEYGDTYVAEIKQNASLTFTDQSMGNFANNKGVS